MISQFRKMLARFRVDERTVLIPLVVLATGIWVFARIADAVSEGSPQRFDDWAIRIMRTPGHPADPIGPAWLGEIGRDLTAIGGVAVLLLVIVAVVGFLLLQDKRRSAAFVAAASVGGLLLSLALKSAFHRPRPNLVPALSAVYTSSFPSGHSMMSAAVYLTLGSLLARTVKDRATRVYCVAVAALVIVLVGVSRVYMGVHYPSDVLAGWAAGASWAVLCWLVATYLQNRGVVEHADEEQGA